MVFTNPGHALTFERMHSACWAMAFDDRKCSLKMNSVFASAESANKRCDELHGKMVLLAYFGSPPNHS